MTERTRALRLPGSFGALRRLRMTLVGRYPLSTLQQSSEFQERNNGRRFQLLPAMEEFQLDQKLCFHQDAANLLN